MTCKCSEAASLDAADEPSLLRRRLLVGAVAAGTVHSTAFAADPRAERPRRGDVLVYAEGERKGRNVVPGELDVTTPPTFAYPMDPESGVIRDRNRLNQVVLLRIDPKELTPQTAPRAAEGIVAYSAICTHYGCPITLRHPGGRAVICNCHGSTFDLANNGEVLAGPAPRRLALLPVATADGNLVVAAAFNGRLGPPQQ